jgi:hypothetical protein
MEDRQGKRHQQEEGGGESWPSASKENNSEKERWRERWKGRRGTGGKRTPHGRRGQGVRIGSVCQQESRQGESGKGREREAEMKTGL